MEIALRPFTEADADWLVTEHVTYYARVEGFDASFGPLVRGIVSDFLDADGIEIPMDFDPEEADEIAEEIKAAAQAARAVKNR